MPYREETENLYGQASHKNNLARSSVLPSRVEALTTPYYDEEYWMMGLVKVGSAAHHPLLRRRILDDGVGEGGTFALSFF